jgi:hypothetical protein
VTELYNLLEVRESLQVQLIPGIETVQLMHEFLKDGLSYDIMVSFTVVANNSLR